MDERDVYDVPFPEQAEAEAACLQADLDYIHRELMRDGVTLLLLCKELRQSRCRGVRAQELHDVLLQLRGVCRREECHKPSRAQAEAGHGSQPKWDDRRILRYFKEVGPSTYAVVVRIFDVVRIKEQAYNSVLTMLNLMKFYAGPVGRGPAPPQPSCGDSAMERLPGRSGRYC